MNISELSIRRPVLSTVLTLIILLFGFIGYNYLGVREYPSVDNPIISVSCSYPGANADVIENQITEPLEQNINGIPGIRSLSSVSQQGSSRITVEFELSVDLETAANDVRDKVSRAQRYLPRDCDPPTVSKADADAMPILMVALQSDKRSLLELSEIADLTVKEQLQTISDVSSVSIWGEKRYSMRLWLDPIKMSGYGITPIDVKNAVDNENVELPSGSIEGNTVELTIRTLGLMHTAEEFNNLILKEDGNRIVRFSDIGRAELGPADIKSYMKMNGEPMVGIVVISQPGANHIQIADAVYERMEKMKKDLPEDVHYSYGFDNTKFIRASINEVKQTVYEAFILVIIIIFLFLRDWRVTLVPCIVIPVSLIGAFFVMYLAGFSINVLSMLAIVLAVGLVVDDAIVMTENIYVRIERGMPPKEAGIEGAKEIFFAVISTTITLVAVFFPIVFMDGMTGRLFREFSIVVSGSVIISSFAALTFTPMLATKLLIKREKQSWFYRKTEPFFEGMNRIYSRSLAAFLRKRWIALPFTAATILIIGFLWNYIPAEMAPLEDRSQISINTRGAEGVTYEYIRDYTEDINLLVDSITPDAEAVTARVSSGSGNIRITLKDMQDRDYTQMEVAEKLSKAVQKKTMARSFVQQSSSFGGRRGGMPVQYVLQATNIEKLQEVLPKFMAKVYENPVFQMADVDLKFSKPEARININRDKASIMGCTPLLGFILSLIVRRVAPMYTKLQSMVDRLNNVVQEGLTAIRAVKAFVRDEYEEDKFNEVNTDLTAASEQTFHYAVLNLPAFQGVMYTAIVLILWFGGNMILKKQLAVGNLTGFLSYVMQVMNSMMMIANVFLLLTRSMASAHRIVEVLDEKIVLTSPENGVTEVTEGSVEFDNVSFKYKEEAKEYALSDVTLKIKAGQTVGILGGTGSSKTTLVQLIPRLYDTSRGTVRVGGKDVRAYDLAALRDAVNIILQKNVLFSGTVRENLKWGNVDASDEEIWEACRAACADEFLNRMPDGLDTVLEQGASNLSGGQKQRLCIARALIGKAKILIFDDSTSAVDTATEKKIREALAARKNVTKIIIAQRVTSVMNTDQIIILDDGKVHRIGTHAELLADDPIYQEIYASQMKGGDENGSESL